MFTLDMVEVQSLDVGDNYGKIQITPLERGYGITLGNSLRRVLLSSLEGAAITHIEIEGIYHEFTTIPGVVEDVIQFILNLKGVRLKIHSTDSVTLKIEKKGEGIIKAGDIIAPDDVKILNPDHYLATTNEDADLRINMIAKRGKGYIPGELNKDPDLPIDFIPIDSIFSPVERVNFNIENTRVGNMTNFEKLTLEIWTDGSITPEEAMVDAVKILINYLSKFLPLVVTETPVLIGEEKTKINSERDKILEKTIEELDLSVRAYNCLKKVEVNTVEELIKLKPSDLLKVRNLGKKTLKEINEKLESISLTLQNAESGGEKDEA